MEDNLFLNAGIISVIYLVFRFMEMRFILKENKPIKLLMRDTLLVYVSIVLGKFLLRELMPVKDLISGSNIDVFTNNPDF